MLKNTFLYAESWNVAFRKRTEGTLIEDTNTPFIVIKNNFRYWAADPFVVEAEGKTYIFAELYDYIRRRGILGYCTVDGGKASKWEPIFCEKYHLSYPCLIQRDGETFLMPESGEGEVLTAYKLIEFPDKWEKRQILIENVKFADTTPVEICGKDFALTHKVDNPDDPELILFNLKDKDKKNFMVVKKGLRSRPAGHLFVRDGKAFRPAQISLNTAEGYGKGLVFCQCFFDKERGYSESEIKEIYPEQLRYDKDIFLDGMHTYNVSEHYEVIDIKTRRFNLLNFVMRILGKFL